MKRAAVAIAALGLLSAGALLARPVLEGMPAQAQVQAQAGKPEAKAAEVGRYGMVTTAQGMLYFLDTKTGQMWRHTPDEDPVKWKPYPSPVSGW